MAKNRTAYDRENTRRYNVLAKTSEHGRSQILLECPFCENQFWAYIWSLSGGGKKCPDCGALHHKHGSAAPVIKQKGE